MNREGLMRRVYLLERVPRRIRVVIADIERREERLPIREDPSPNFSFIGGPVLDSCQLPGSTGPKELHDTPSARAKEYPGSRPRGM
jgi:hypothetical protein